VLGKNLIELMLDGTSAGIIFAMFKEHFLKLDGVTDVPDNDNELLGPID